MKRKNIILCGFMGCGKSTIGNLLSKKMGMAFIDLDAYIEKKENKSVSQIFADSGEEYFRQLERDAVKELAYKKSVILATGGGTLTFRENVDVLRNADKRLLTGLFQSFRGVCRFHRTIVLGLFSVVIQGENFMVISLLLGVINAEFLKRIFVFTELGAEVIRADIQTQTLA